MNRRDFLKALGITGGASALSACGLDNNRYKTPLESILPYVVKPDQVTPGTPTFFASTALTGPHAQSVTARHRDGRVVFLSANFQAPTAPAVNTASMFELQKHYSPDRITGPTKGGQFTDWETARSELAGAVKAAKAGGKKVAFLGGYKGPALTQLLNDFADTAIFWEADGYEAEATAAKRLFGKSVLPFYDYSKSDFVLSFGAPFLGGWGDSDGPARFAKGKDPNEGKFVTRFALVAPFRGQTGVNSDDWLACKPGSEVVVARAIAAIVAERKNASSGIKALIGRVSADDAAAASGLSAAEITSVAENFANGKGLAVPGGISGTSDLAAATYLLNLAADSSGERFTLGGFQGSVHGAADLEALKADLDAGRIGVLLIDDVNPAYSVPANIGLTESLGKAGMLVSVSSHPSETSASAAMVLPTNSTIEDWGHEEPVSGLHLLRQPAMSPLYDTVPLGDLILTVARAAGLEAPAAAAVAVPIPTPVEEGSEGEPLEGEPVEAAPVVPPEVGFTPANWAEYVAKVFERDVWDGNGQFADFWERSVIAGFHQAQGVSGSPALTVGAYTFAEAAEKGSGDLFLEIYSHPFRRDGRYANQPWAQETPDPISGIVWDSWLEVSDHTAKELGLQSRDMVEISAPGGALQLAVYPHPGVADGVVAIATGNGHTASGRYANGYGVNAFGAAEAGKDANGAMTWGPLKVSLKKLGRRAGKYDLATAFSEFGRSDEGRGFGLHVSAEKLAEHGDEAAHHAGELTGRHQLELDERLLKAQITDFYGLPDHPTYRFGLTVDVNACNGCGACSVACYAENNLPVVGKDKVAEGREMGWIRINRYWETDIGGQDDVRFVPMMCQHCGHAGCENVCPVLATYHNLDGLNAMVYNRCAGTRYCSNACPFSARKFNYHSYIWPEPFNLQLNPDVSTRTMGVMEKCTFCVQRIRQTKSAYRDGGNFTRTVPQEAWEQVPACVEACPSQALTFGNLKDEASYVSKSRKSARAYQPLADLNVFGAVTYLAKANFHDDPTTHHGGDPGGGEHADSQGEDHGEAAGHDEAGAH